MTDNKEMTNQMNSMTTIMVVIITLTSFSLSTALSFYWITTYAFIAIQTYLFKRLSGETKNKKDKKDNKNKKIKDKLEIKRGLKYGNNN